MIVADT